MIEAGKLIRASMAGRVKRWHTAETTTPQSVAEHSFGVALILLRIVPEEFMTVGILKAALLHDMGELETGDIPYATKKRLEENNRGAQAVLDQMEQEALSNCCDSFPQLSPVEKDYLHCADLMEMFIYALIERSRGNVFAEDWMKTLKEDLKPYLSLGESVREVWHDLCTASNQGQAGVLRALAAAGFR